jgi:hypothetical protein
MPEFLFGEFYPPRGRSAEVGAFFANLQTPQQPLAIRDLNGQPGPRVQLEHLAHARSGDKGDSANVGVIAYDAAQYDLLRKQLTAERVKAHFGYLVKGPVERFELPNLHALNFLLHNALDGGGTVSLMNDAQGKVMSTAMLRMEIEVPDDVAKAVAGKGRMPGTAVSAPS